MSVSIRPRSSREESKGHCGQATECAFTIKNDNVQPVTFKVKATNPKSYHTVGKLKPGGSVDVVFSSEDLPSNMAREDIFLIESRLVPATPFQRLLAHMGCLQVHKHELTIRYQPERCQNSSIDERCPRSTSAVNLTCKTAACADLRQSEVHSESNNNTTFLHDRRPGISTAELREMREYLAQDDFCTNVTLFAPLRILRKCFDVAEARVEELDTRYQAASVALNALRLSPDTIDLDAAATTVSPIQISREGAGEALQPALESWKVATEVFRLEAVMDDIEAELQTISESRLMVLMREMIAEARG